MKIIVFGATGRVGKRLVQQALEAGHEVTGFVRNPAGNLPTHARLRLVQGDVHNYAQVQSAIRGQEAVLSALGHRGGAEQPISLLSEGIRNLLRAMDEAGVRRIISVAGAGLLQSTPTQLIKESPTFPPSLQHISADHQRAWQLLEQSGGTDWTLMCPPYIPDDAPSGRYKVKADYSPGGQQVKSGDLAEFMLQEVIKGEFVGKRVGIASE